MHGGAFLENKKIGKRSAVVKRVFTSLSMLTLPKLIMYCSRFELLREMISCPTQDSEIEIDSPVENTHKKHIKCSEVG